jgi:hypothetical protein
MTYLHFAVDLVASADSPGRASTGNAVVAPVPTLLSIRTIARHVASVAADTADDAGSEVLALGAVVLAMSDLTTVLAGLVFVVSERSVECSEFSELVALEFVLAFGNRCSLES